jgi:class 3 adenylate cyclase
VNLASRIADLCGRLGQSLLLSGPFQSRLSEHELKNLGAFTLKGVGQRQTVFAPVESEA